MKKCFYFLRTHVFPSSSECSSGIKGCSQGQAGNTVGLGLGSGSRLFVLYLRFEIEYGTTRFPFFLLELFRVSSSDDGMNRLRQLFSRGSGGVGAAAREWITPALEQNKKLNA